MDDEVFRALADASRRTLLDRLFERDGQTLGELEAALPYASLPHEFLLARAVSLEELDELVERQARREELAGR